MHPAPHAAHAHAPPVQGVRCETPRQLKPAVHHDDACMPRCDACMPRCLQHAVDCLLRGLLALEQKAFPLRFAPTWESLKRNNHDTRGCYGSVPPHGARCQSDSATQKCRKKKNELRGDQPPPQFVLLLYFAYFLMTCDQQNQKMTPDTRKFPKSA